MVTNEDDLIFQSLYTVMLIKALDEAKLLDSTYFDSLPLSPDVRHHIKHIRVGNQGCLLMFLYALLVLPRELIEDKYKTEYAEIDKTLNSWNMKTESTYGNGEPPHEYIRRIRNAVSHGRVSFEPEKFVRFEDKDKKDKNGKSLKFSTEMPLSKDGQNVGEFLNRLLSVHAKYSADRQPSK